ncbi:MAG: hypothetical protein ABIJ91_02170 [Candidatus Kuenenbacteria bacterium]
MSNTNKKLVELKNLVDGAEISLQQARQILDVLVGNEGNKDLMGQFRGTGAVAQTSEGQVIEGLFDGQNMVGPDGKKYSVPANYASKSKMVEGDGLKLTITADGSFIYKQINPLEREHLTGKLVIDEETGDYRVLANGKSYKILTASVTYFKGEEGDSAAILAPKGKESSWAAVENIFRIEDREEEIKKSVVLAEDKEDKEDKEDETDFAIAENKPVEEEEKNSNFLDSMPKTDDLVSDKNVFNQGLDSDGKEKSNEFLLPEPELKAGPSPEFEPAVQQEPKVEENAEPYMRQSAVEQPKPDPNQTQPQDIFSSRENTPSDTEASQSPNQFGPTSANNVFQHNNQKIDDLAQTQDRQGLEEI